MEKKNTFKYRYFFNAGIDDRNGICDGEGCDIFEVDEDGTQSFLGSIYNVFPEQLDQMTDEEIWKYLCW